MICYYIKKLIKWGDKMFIPYPMLIIFNQTSMLIKDVNITSTHPLWKEKCKKIKKQTKNY